MSAARVWKRIGPYLLLTALAGAVFNLALAYPPSTPDDVVLLSRAAHVGDPWTFGAYAWPFGLHLFRPLPMLVVLVMYRLFGVAALPNQLLSLGLHVVNACLLFRLLSRWQPSRLLCFLLAGVFLISRFTASPATWVTDRPSLFVGLTLILLLGHLRGADERRTEVRVGVVCVLIVVALLSKETGLVLAGLGMLALARSRHSHRERLRAVALPLLVVAAYLCVRIGPFGRTSAAHLTGNEARVLMGIVAPEGSATPSLARQIVVPLEKIAKSVVSFVVPVFGDSERFEPNASPLSVPIWVATAFSFVVAAWNADRVVQRRAWWIVLLNAVIHAHLFSYRFQYLTQLAFALHIGAFRWEPSRRASGRALATALGVLLAVSCVDVGSSLHYGMAHRLGQLELFATGSENDDYPTGIDPDVVARIVSRYRSR